MEKKLNVTNHIEDHIVSLILELRIYIFLFEQMEWTLVDFLSLISYYNDKQYFIMKLKS